MIRLSNDFIRRREHANRLLAQDSKRGSWDGTTRSGRILAWDIARQ